MRAHQTLLVLLGVAALALLLVSLMSDPPQIAQDDEIGASPDGGPVLRVHEPADPSSDSGASAASAGTLFVRVLENGRPVEATVRVGRCPPHTGSVEYGIFDASLAPIATHETPTWLFDHRVAAGASAQVALDAGRYEIHARLDEHRAGMRRLTLVAGTRSVELDLWTGSHSHTGRAKYGDSSPFRGWLLFRAITDDNIWTPTWLGPVRCGPDGAFTLAALAGVDQEIWAVDPHSGFGSVRESLPIPTTPGRTWFVDALTQKIEGRVLSAATQKPVAGAAVRTSMGYGGRSDLVNQTRTDADGRFSLRVPERGRSIAVVATGFAAWRQHLPLNTREVTVHLIQGSGLRGRIVPAAGASQPLAGVTLYAGHQRATTDDAGRFTFDVVPGEAYSLFALGNGWCTKGLAKASWRSRFQPLRVSRGRKEIDLSVEPTATVEGTVRWANREPVPGARVQAKNRGGHRVQKWIASTVTCDEQGRFTLRDLVPDLDYDIIAVDAKTQARDLEVVVVRTGKTANVDVTLVRPHRVEIRVRDADTDQPVRAAAIVYDDDTVVARTDENGVASARRPPDNDEAELYAVRAHGYAQGTLLVPPGRVKPIRLALRRGLVTTGVVRLPEDTLLPASTRAKVLGEVWNQFTLDDEGRFEVRLTEGTHKIYASCEVNGRSYRASRQIEAGSRGIVLEVRASAKAFWQLDVTGPDGRRPTRIHANTFVIATNGGGNMNFGQEFADGRIRVAATTWNRIPLWVEVYGATAADGTELGWAPALVGPLDRKGGERAVSMSVGATIRGRVQWSDGAPLPGVFVRANPTDGPVQGWGRRDHLNASAYTNEAGEFALVGLADQAYKLGVDGPLDGARLDEVDEVAPGTSDVLVRFGPVPDVVITVIDEEGQPVRNARVYTGSNARTDDAGHALIRGLVPARPRLLSVAATGLRTHREKEWQPRDTTVQLSRGKTIRGHLLDLDGTPYGEAKIELHRNGKPVAGTWCESDGRFEFGKLEAGTYHLHAVDGEQSLGEASEVVAGDEAVKLRVDAGPQVRVRILGLDAASEMVAYLTSEGNALDKPRPDERQEWVKDGRVRFARVDPQVPYTFSMHQGAKYAVIRGMKPSNDEVSVAMQVGGTIRGRIVNMTDYDKTFGLEVFIQSGGVFASAEADLQGNFVLSGVPPGTWTIHAAHHIPGSIGKSTATVGDTDVVIDVTRK